MAISKSAKIQAEIEKVTAKINEQQARLKELEQKKLEAENSEIVEIVRGMSVSLTNLPVLLQTIKSGGTLSTRPFCPEVWTAWSYRERPCHPWADGLCRV